MRFPGRPLASANRSLPAARGSGSRLCRQASGRTEPAPARSGPRRPVRPGRESRRPGRCRLTSSHACRNGSPASSSSRINSPGSTDGLGKDGRQLAADHHPDQVAASDIVHSPGARPDAVAQRRHAIGDLGQLFQAMRDVDDADSLRLQIGDDAEEPGRLLCR